MPHASNTSHQQRQEDFLQAFLPVQQRFESFVFAMCRNDEQARDVIGETVLRAYEKFHSIRQQQALLSYLFTTSRRILLRWRWRAKLFGEYHHADAESCHYTGIPPDIATDISLLYQALGKLPFKQREALVLHDLSGFTLLEIQQLQGGSISSIKMRLSRGRAALGKLLGGTTIDLEASSVIQPTITTPIIG